MPIKIMLDAGHYGSRYNQSPVVPDYYESNMTWVLCSELKKSLEKYGFEVGTTRSKKDENPSLNRRGKASKGYDLFISLHSNAAYDPCVDRVSVYHSFDNLNNSELLAGMLSASVAELMEVSKGVVKTRESKEYPGTEYYGVLNGARKVGTPLYYIIEHSFHTNEKSAKWLLDPINLVRLAETEAAIIASYFDEKDSDEVAGDVNGDGVLSALDYMIIKRAVLGSITLSREETYAADVNKDGEVDSRDYMTIKRAILGDIEL